jgi:plastocyanin
VFSVRFRVALIIFGLTALAARGDVTVQAVLKGAPGSQDETFVASASGCGEGSVRQTENWKVGPKGELADVVVWVESPKYAGAPVAPQVTLRQLGCRYVPHVIAVQAGVDFTIINGDPTLHNIRAQISLGPGLPPGDTVFNFGQVYRGQTDARQFADPGIYTLRCDVHSWMQAWVMVLKDGCFGVTGADGTGTLNGGATLLDGTYTVKAWHPRFPAPLTQQVQVKGGVAAVRFVFDGAQSF